MAAVRTGIPSVRTSIILFTFSNCATVLCSSLASLVRHGQGMVGRYPGMLAMGWVGRAMLVTSGRFCYQGVEGEGPGQARPCIPSVRQSHLSSCT